MQDAKKFSRIFFYVLGISLVVIINYFLGFFVESYQGKYGGWAIIDTNGRIVSDKRYAFITEFNSNGIAFAESSSFYEKGQYGFGFVDVEGNHVYPEAFEGIESVDVGYKEGSMYSRYYIDDEVFIFQRHGEIYVFSFEDEEIQVVNSDDSIVNYIWKYVEDKEAASSDNKKLFLRKGGDWPNDRYGFVDAYGNVVVDYKFYSAKEFSNGFAVVGDLKYGYINEKGEEVIPRKYDHAYDFTEDGIARVIKHSRRKSDSYIGYIDSEGKELLSPQFEYATDFHGGYAVVLLDYGKFIKYNLSRDVRWRISYNIKAFFLSMLFLYYRYRFHLLAAFSAYVVIYILWATHSNCHSVGGGYHVINSKGKMYRRKEYASISQFNEHGVADGVMLYRRWKSIVKKYAVVRPNGRVLFLTSFKGEKTEEKQCITEVVSEDFSNDLHDGLTITKSPETGKYGFANEAGEVVIPCEFDEVRNFSEGFAAVKQDDGWGFIKTDGSFFIKPLLKDVVDFSHGYAAIWTTDDADLEFLMDKKK